MGQAFFPLDEELGLLPGELTPLLHEWVVRLASWATFGPAAQMVGEWSGAQVSEPTVRRLTEQAGAAWVQVQTAEVTQLERAAPDPAAAPAVLQLSVDGAMVPLVGGQWTEVKTLALGEVQPGQDEQGRPVGHTVALSYCSRRAGAEQFSRLALGEIWRRGVPMAGVVCAVVDGAVWQQGFIDDHRPDAVRILDFPHGVEHLGKAAGAVWGTDSAAGKAWLGERKREWCEEGPEPVLQALRELGAEPEPEPLSATAAAVRDEVLRYLEARREQTRYAEFRAQGYPIGSGCVESANKLVVEARLKGSGMHWALEHVNPMVALRTVVCNDRWAEAWPQMTGQLRREAAGATQVRRQQRQTSSSTAGSEPPRTAASTPPAPRPTPSPAPPRSEPPKKVVNGRPTAEHPWKRAFLTGSRSCDASHAKL